MTTRLFAIDFGASGGKCFAATLNDGQFAMQEIHRFAHEGVNFYLPDASGKEVERAYWNDTLLYANTVAGLQAYGRDVSDTLDAIGLDTWGADGAFVSPDGDIINKIYAYRDHRLDGVVDQIKSRIDPERVYAITGINFQPFNLSTQLLWTVQNRPRLVADDVRFFPVPSIFLHYLGAGHEVDYSWASISQLMDAATRDWSDEMCTALGIPRAILPRIVDPGTVLGTLRAPIAESAGINQPSLVATAAHDTASAFAAAPVSDPDDALIISSGTWSIVGKLVPEPITTPEAAAMGASNEGGIGNVRFLKNVMGTWILQELRRIWGVADGSLMAWEEISKQAHEAAPFACLIDPDAEGFYNPANMEAAIHEFCTATGQPPPADRGAGARCVLESLALKYRQVNAQLETVTGSKNRVIHVVGGGCKNELLNQFTADCTGLPVQAGPEEATAVGNLMVQALGLGAIKDIGDAQPIIKSAFPIRSYAPGDPSPWNAAYEQFKHLGG